MDSSVDSSSTSLASLKERRKSSLKNEEVVRMTPYTVGMSLPDIATQQRLVVREDIATLLFTGNLDLLSVICKINQFGDGNTVSTSIIAFLLQYGQAENFVLRMLATRIENSTLSESKDLTNVLRDNSMTVMLLTAFAKSEGAGCLVDVLLTPITNILPFVGSLEINPESLAGGQEEAKDNLDNLVKAVEVVFESISQKVDRFPSSFRLICWKLRENCEQKLGNESLLTSEYRVQCSLRLVGSFVFLRYFCPAITTPQLFNVSPKSNFTPEERRGLILLAKIFISLGADSDFAAKEDYLSPLKERLGHIRDQMKDYLTKISSPLDALPKPRNPLDNFVFEKTIDNIITFLNKSAKKIEDVMVSYPELQQQYAELVSLLQTLDTPRGSPSVPGLATMAEESSKLIRSGSSKEDDSDAQTSKEKVKEKRKSKRLSVSASMPPEVDKKDKDKDKDNDKDKDKEDKDKDKKDKDKEKERKSKKKMSSGSTNASDIQEELEISEPLVKSKRKSSAKSNLSDDINLAKTKEDSGKQIDNSNNNNNQVNSNGNNSSNNQSNSSNNSNHQNDTNGTNNNSSDTNSNTNSNNNNKDNKDNKDGKDNNKDNNNNKDNKDGKDNKDNKEKPKKVSAKQSGKSRLKASLSFRKGMKEPDMEESQNPDENENQNGLDGEETQNLQGDGKGFGGFFFGMFRRRRAQSLENLGVENVETQLK